MGQWLGCCSIPSPRRPILCLNSILGSLFLQKQWLEEKCFPVTHCSQSWGAEQGLVWCHFLSFSARRELLGGLVRLSRQKT